MSAHDPIKEEKSARVQSRALRIKSKGSPVRVFNNDKCQYDVAMLRMLVSLR